MPSGLIRNAYEQGPGAVREFWRSHPLPRAAEPLGRFWYPLLAGQPYRQTRALLRESWNWPQEAQRDYQTSQLRSILSVAAASSAFYREHFENCGFSPTCLTQPEDIRVIPPIGRTELRARHHEMQTAFARGSQAISHHTGGTTSSPVHFLESASAWGFENAFFADWRERLGYRVGQRCVLVGGSDRGPSVTYNPVANLLAITVNDVTDNGLDRIIEEIVRFDPVVIRGYPSLIYQIASRWLQTRKGRCLRHLLRVFLSSEKVLRYQGDRIRLAFGVPITSHYGQSERVALIQQCTNGDTFHVRPEYSYVEVLDDEDRPVTQPGAVGRIVGTGFANKATPLVRYRTNDWAVYSGWSHCPACRRDVQEFSQIEGRSGDFVFTPGGKRLSPTVLDIAGTHISHLRELQIRQRSLNGIVLLVVPDHGFTENDAQGYVAELKKVIGERDFEVRYEVVDRIERPPNQKQRLVVSELSGPSTALEQRISEDESFANTSQRE